MAHIGSVSLPLRYWRNGWKGEKRIRKSCELLKHLADLILMKASTEIEMIPSASDTSLLLILIEESDRNSYFDQSFSFFDLKM